MLQRLAPHLIPQSDHLYIINGQTGSGKTWIGSALGYNCPSRRVLYFDPKSEVEFGKYLIDEEPKMLAQVLFESTSGPCMFTYYPGRASAYDVGSELAETIMDLGDASARAGEEIPEWLIIIDEGFLTKGTTVAADDPIAVLARLRRKYNVVLVFLSQRPSDFSKSIRSQCTDWISFWQTDPDDIRVLRAVTQDPNAELIHRLSKEQGFEFCYLQWSGGERVKFFDKNDVALFPHDDLE